ncbi:MAG: Ig-like domain-containing protein [Verrucomicrobiota bacterium JB022]|nr:Ig-like domain-containing protein [Verrucomicrobiota bacterium JB022]
MKILPVAWMALLCAIFGVCLEAQVLVYKNIELNGVIEGNVLQVHPESVILNSGAEISGDLYVVGSPSIVTQGGKLGQIVEGGSVGEPIGSVVTLNHGSTLATLKINSNPPVWPAAATYLPPAGSRWITLSLPSDALGEAASIKGLTLNQGAGSHALPAGSYGSWSINAGSALVLGVAGASEPAVYYVENLLLNAGGAIAVAGPVDLRIKNWTSMQGVVGDAARPDLLRLEIVEGGLTLNTGAEVFGEVRVVNQRLTLNDRSRIVGPVVAKWLTLNSGARIDQAPLAVFPEPVPTPSELTPDAFQDDGNLDATVRAQVRHFPTLNGRLSGDLQQMLPEGGSVNGGAQVEGDWYLPGDPTIVQNGTPTFAGVAPGAGAASPSGHTLYLNSGATLQHIVTRTDATELPRVGDWTPPSGTRQVTLNTPSDLFGDPLTLRDLNLNSNVGLKPLPAGRYGRFTVNAGSGLVLGTTGAETPEVYSFESLTLNGNSQLEVAGPVVIRLRDSLTINGKVGSSANPAWVRLEARGDVTLNTGCTAYAIVIAPDRHLMVNGRLRGNFAVDRLTLNSSGRIDVLAPLNGSVGPEPENQTPVVSDQAFQTAEGAPLAALLVAFDPDGDDLAFEMVEAPAHGRLRLQTDGSFVYEPPPGFHGSDTFVFSVSDGALSGRAVAVITVAAVNDVPVAQDLAFTTPEDTALAGQLAGQDADGDALTYTLVSGPAYGQVVIQAEGGFTYTPPLNFNGKDTFIYQVSDGEYVATAIVSIEVEAVNDVPIMADSALETIEDVAVVGHLTATDVDGDELRFSLVDGPSFGAAIVAMDGSFRYEPRVNFNGLDSFRVAVSDGELSAQAQVVVTVAPVNDAPHAIAATYTTPEDTVLSGLLSATDVDGDALSFALVSDVQHGSLGLVSDGSFHYTPTTDYFGPDSFTFSVSDGQTSSSAKVTIEVEPRNDAPVAEDLFLETDEDQSLLGTIPAHDVDGDHLTFTVRSAPERGIITFIAGADFRYDPLPGFSGTDGFEILISDGEASVVATIVITVRHINHDPFFTSTPITAVEVSEEKGAYILATFRDFTSSHPDMQWTLSGWVKNLVMDALGDDGTPVLNTAISQNAIQSEDSFYQWFHDVPGVNETARMPLFLAEKIPGSGIYEFQSSQFFPLTSRLLDFGSTELNRYFTMTGHSTFTYRGGEQFSFRGDDDVWVFIDRKLVVDLGGVHGPVEGNVDLDTLGLTVGKTYDFDIFFAERYCCGSNFFLTTSLELVPPPHYQHRVQASDEDGDFLTYHLIEHPVGMMIDAQSGMISWSPESQGAFKVVIEVRDDNGGRSQQEFGIVVALPLETRPRFLSRPPFAFGVEGECLSDEFRYFPVVEDVDAIPYEHIFTLLSGPSDAVLDSKTGLLTFKVTGDTPAFVPVSIMVLDRNDEFSIQEFTVEILNRPPLIEPLDPILLSAADFYDTVVWIEAAASDPDESSENLTYFWHVLSAPTTGEESPDDLVLVDEPTSPGTRATFLRQGVYLLELEVSDGIAVARQRQEIRISEDCEPSPSGLIAFWDGNDGYHDLIGDVPLDGGECGHYSEGKFLGGFSFDSRQELEARVPHLAEQIAESEEVTVEFWFKRAGAGVDGIFRWGDLGALSDYSGSRFYCAYPTTTGIATPYVSVALGMEWHHVAFLLKKEDHSFEVYLDGVRIFKVVNANLNLMLSDVLRLGGYDHRRMTGSLDEFAIYDRVLTGAEIVSLYQGKGMGRCPVYLPNSAPMVTIEEDLMVTTVGDPLPLNGDVSDDGAPLNQLWMEWDVLEAPNSTGVEDPRELVSFSDRNVLDPQVNFTRPGTYRLQLEVSDGLASGRDEVTVRVDDLCTFDSPPDLIAFWDGTRRWDQLGAIELDVVAPLAFMPGIYTTGFHFANGQELEADVGALLESIAETGEVTVEFWMRRSGAGTDGLFRWGDFGVLSDYNGARLYFTYPVAGGSSSPYAGVALGTDWHHMAVVLSEPEQRLRAFVDGKQVYTLANPDLRTRLSETLLVGAYDHRRLNGELDEFAIYSRALDAAEIGALYKAGGSGRCPVGFLNEAPLIDITQDPLAGSVGESIGLGASVSDDGLPGGDVVTEWKVLMGPIANGEEPSGLVAFKDVRLAASTASFARAGSYLLQLTANDGLASVTKFISVRIDEPCSVDSPEGLVAFWDGNSDFDRKGNLEARSQNLAGHDAGIYLNGFGFQGGQSFLVSSGEAAAQVEHAGALTVEFWFKRDGAGVDGLFRWGNVGLLSDYNGARIYCTYPTVSGYTTFYVGSSLGTEWHHISVVLDQSESSVTLYLDGIQVYHRIDGSMLLEVAETLIFGAFDTRTLAGRIDELAIYSRALSGSEIQSIYAARGAGRCPPIPTNLAPFVDAGDSSVVTWPQDRIWLHGVFADDGLPEGGGVSTGWTVEPAQGAAIIDPSALDTEVVFSVPGDYTFTLTADDSELQGSDSVTVSYRLPANTAPVVDAGADRTVALHAQVTLEGSVSDDGLPLPATLTAQWSLVSGPGNVSITQPNAIATQVSFDTEGTYVLALSASDGDLTGIDEVTIIVEPLPNQPPQIDAGPDQKVTLQAGARLVGQVADDGLPLGGWITAKWLFISGPAPVEIELPQGPEVQAYFSKAGTYVLQFYVSDGELYSLDYVTIEVVHGPEVAWLSPTDEAVLKPGLPLTLMVRATDADGTIAQVELFADGQSLGFASAAGGDTFTLSLPDNEVLAPVSHLTAVATDDSGFASDPMGITLYVSDDNAPPFAELTSPAADSIVTAPTAVVGTVTSALLEQYTLAHRLKGTSEWTVFATGTQEVTAGVLGTFDPTMLRNGIYEVQLRAVDVLGRSYKVAQSVVVDSQMKVGHFALAFEDLQLPVSGIPVQILRSYDSRGELQGDFGRGWDLGLRAVQVYENHALGSEWYLDATSSGLSGRWVFRPVRPAIVTVVLGDGQVEQFEAYTEPQGTVIGPQPTAAVLRFRPIHGSVGSLALTAANPSFPLVDDDGDGIYQIDDFGAGVLDPEAYVYTALDGTRLEIAEVLGLRKVTDRNQNTLRITEDGVFHSSGRSIAFTRDGAGRITRIEDPDGNALAYDYDTEGRLVKFTDREGNDPESPLYGTFTEYRYENAAFPYYLTEVIDPRGVRAIRTEYDEQGRVIGQVDAEGFPITLEHDIPTRKEVIVDRLGFETVHEYDFEGNVVATTTVDPENLEGPGLTTRMDYDVRGNVTREEDPLGNVTERTYDARNNVLSETQYFTNAEGEVAVATTTYTYDANSNPLTIEDPNGNVTEFAYDAAGNLTRMEDASGNVTAFAYNARGDLTSMTDGAGNTTAHEYDSLGNTTRTELRDANGNVLRVSSYTYDSRGNQTSQTQQRTVYDATGTALEVETATTQYAYDRNDRVVQTTYADGTTSRVEYNAIGKQARTIDQLGRPTTYAYDARGNLIQTTYADGRFDSTVYDAEGRSLSRTDRAGRTTYYIYDALGRVVRTILPDETMPADPAALRNVEAVLAAPELQDNPFTSNDYDALGRVETSVDALGHATFYTYDDQCGCSGRRGAVTDALGRVTKSFFDAAGNQVAVEDALGRTTSTTYDALSRPTVTTYADGTTTETVYDTLGRRVASIDQKGKRTDYGYDALGRLLTVTQPAPEAGGDRPVTTYAYDEAGNVTAQTDAEGHTTRYGYDVMGRRTWRALPEGQVEHYTYHLNGALTTRTDFNGYTTTYTYDGMDRLVTEEADPSHPSLIYAHATAKLEYTYDGTGQLTSAATYNYLDEVLHREIYAYDAQGHLISKQSAEGTLTYSYNPAGQLTGVASNNANGVQLAYDYDELGRLAQVYDHGAQQPPLAHSYAYDEVGNLAAMTYANDITHVWSYGSLYRLTNLDISHTDGRTYNSYAYTLSRGGMRTRQTETSGRVVDYVYDQLYRLQRETVADDPHGNNGSVSYTYDDVGNRLTRASSLAGVGAQTFGYSANDWLTRDAYDFNGNTTLSPAGTDVYDYRNKLIRRTTGSGEVIDVSYDVYGDRFAKTVGDATTYYLVDRNNLTGYSQVLEELVEDFTGSLTVQKVYAYGHDLISQTQLLPQGAPDHWETSYYLYDGLGTVRALVDEAGLVTDAYTYDAFGLLLSATGHGTPNAYLYTGEQWDADLGMYFLRARYLNPETGRFHTLDTYEGFRSDPQTLHKYLYAHGNPVMGVDPSGMFAQAYSLSSASVGLALLGVVALTYMLHMETAAISVPWPSINVWPDEVEAPPSSVTIPLDMRKEVMETKSGTVSVSQAQRIRSKKGDCKAVIGENWKRVAHAISNASTPMFQAEAFIWDEEGDQFLQELAELRPMSPLWAPGGRSDLGAMEIANFAWIENIMSRGCLIYDIGFDTSRSSRNSSSFLPGYYLSELEWTRFYPNKSFYLYPNGSQLK